MLTLISLLVFSTVRVVMNNLKHVKSFLNVSMSDRGAENSSTNKQIHRQGRALLCICVKTIRSVWERKEGDNPTEDSSKDTGSKDIQEGSCCMQHCMLKAIKTLKSVDKNGCKAASTFHVGRVRNQVFWI